MGASRPRNGERGKRSPKAAAAPKRKPAAPATHAPDPGRTAAGTFARGNAGGPGGAREGAGRPADQIKQAARAFWAGKRAQAEAVLLAALEIPDVAELAAELAKAKTKDEREAVVMAWQAKYGQFSGKDRLKAAELVFAYCDGRPTQRIELPSGSGRALELLDQAERGDLREVAGLGVKYQERRR